MISVSILPRFMGFGSLVSVRFHPVIYTGGGGRRRCQPMLAVVRRVVASQAGIIFMVIAGRYAGAAHAALLAAMLAFVVHPTRTAVRLRRIEGECYRWRLVGGAGRPGGRQRHYRRPASLRSWILWRMYPKSSCRSVKRFSSSLNSAMPKS